MRDQVVLAQVRQQARAVPAAAPARAADQHHEQHEGRLAAARVHRSPAAAMPCSGAASQVPSAERSCISSAHSAGVALIATNSDRPTARRNAVALAGERMPPAIRRATPAKPPAPPNSKMLAAPPSPPARCSIPSSSAPSPPKADATPPASTRSSPSRTAPAARFSISIISISCEELFDRINRELRTQYLLSYYPKPEPPPNVYRHIELRVKGGTASHYRSEYLRPPKDSNQSRDITLAGIGTPPRFTARQPYRANRDAIKSISSTKP